MNQLRLLSVDDLLILRELLGGHSVTSIGQKLGLSQPAITQRIRKMEEAFGLKIIEKDGRRVKLSDDGENLASKAVNALSALEQKKTDKTRDVVKIGIRGDLANNWLFPAILAAKTEFPEIVPNIRPGSDHELLKELHSGRLDAIIGSDSAVRTDDVGHEVGVERNILVASTQLALSISCVDDLRDLTFIDRHSSLPSLRLLPKELRDRLRFKNHWSVGNAKNVAKALEDGFGFGILPDFVAAALLEKGSIQMILTEIEIPPNPVHLVRRSDDTTHEYFESLTKILRNTAIIQS